MIVAKGLFIRDCWTRILARRRVRYKKNCKVLVVQNRCESCECTCGPADCMWTLLYCIENFRSDGHATIVAFTSPSQALAKSTTWL